MSLKTTLSYLTLGTLVLGTGIAQTAPPLWVVVPEQSQLTFSASQSGSPVEGKFNTFTGTLQVDVNDLKNSSIDIIVDINSVSTSYQEIQKTLLTSDWFNVKLFPKAEFKATEFKKTADNGYQAIGTLTIRNKSLPVTLTFTSSFPNENTGVVEGSTVIKRNDFGVGQGQWADVDQIKNEVTVHFKVTAIKK
jgi:polyisoprenoid-binding protein YceI